MFGKKPEGDGKAAGDDKAGDKSASDKAASLEDQKKYLTDKGQKLDGKTDEEIAKLYNDEKAKEGQAPTVDVTKLTLPKDTKAAPELMDGLKAFADKNKLSQEAAQEVVDMGAKLLEKQQKDWLDMKAGWRDEVKKDAELGGHNLEKAVGNAEKVVAKFGGDAKQIEQMQNDLILLGLGNKLSFIRFCNNIMKAVGEDTFDGSSNASSNQPASLAQTMWPNMGGDKK